MLKSHGILHSHSDTDLFSKLDSSDVNRLESDSGGFMISSGLQVKPTSTIGKHTKKNARKNKKYADGVKLTWCLQY